MERPAGAHDDDPAGLAAFRVAKHHGPRPGFERRAEAHRAAGAESGRTSHFSRRPLTAFPALLGLREAESEALLVRHGVDPVISARTWRADSTKPSRPPRIADDASAAAAGMGLYRKIAPA